VSVVDLLIRSDTLVVEGRNETSRASLRGSTTIRGSTVDDVDSLLDPTEWRRLTNGRITMEPLGDRPSKDGDRLYQETFMITAALRLTPLLRVATKSDNGPPTASWLEYRMAPVEDQSPEELIRVDQGSIFIRDVDGGVRITATKRLLFIPPFDAPNLALLADPIGYFDAFEAMVRAALPANGLQEPA
jgi:hypothetical protein